VADRRQADRTNFLIARHRFFIIAGTLSGASGVVLGAFGAHGLASRLSPSDLSTWETAVLYQVLHALLLVQVGVMNRNQPSRALQFAGFSLLSGIVLFSGSLYVLALGGPRLLGPVTPIGGVAFILGWLAIAVSALRPEDPPEPPATG
jgi:uncharacterized membrane protein YgdD (TMEM256/DUF423 family)